MAFVGLRYAVAAQIDTETRGQEITYKPGMVIGKLRSADITYERNSDPLFADDAEAESDNSITGGTITVNLDDLLDDARALIFGDYKDGDSEEYEDNSDASPYVGFGYVRARRLHGKSIFVAYWIHKTQFGSTSEAAATKERTQQWQTPTVTGNVMGVDNNTDHKIRFRRHKSFDNAGAAIAWVNSKAGVTDTAAGRIAAEARI